MIEEERLATTRYSTKSAGKSAGETAVKTVETAETSVQQGGGGLGNAAVKFPTVDYDPTLSLLKNLAAGWCPSREECLLRMIEEYRIATTQYSTKSTLESVGEVAVTPTPSVPLDPTTVYLAAFGDYGPLLLQGGVTAGLLLLLAFLARLLGHYPRFGSGGRAPTSAYECGFAPFAGLASSSLFLFYQLAVFFVIFEAELVFLYPWASALLPAAEAGALEPFLAPVAFLLALFYGYAREIQADALKVLALIYPIHASFYPFPPYPPTPFQRNTSFPHHPFPCCSPLLSLSAQDWPPSRWRVLG
jgi:NADH-quinone oxidoreductase subunit A